MSAQMAVAAALAAGMAVGMAVAALLGAPEGPLPAAVLLERTRALRAPRPRGLRIQLPLPMAWLGPQLARAGWAETPERFVLLAAGVTVTLGAVGAAAGTVVGDGGVGAGLTLLGAAGGVVTSAQLVRAAITRRRERLLAELAPTLDLVGIELSAGSSPLAALAAVTRHGRGELARELRAVLTASGISADRGADVRLQELGERLDLPPLVGLATILGTSRDYGSGVSHGIRAIAVDLRRARRRDLIAQSRRALSRVLVPAAVGVLLPFMAVLLYPAITTLTASFQ